MEPGSIRLRIASIGEDVDLRQNHQVEALELVGASNSRGDSASHGAAATPAALGGSTADGDGDGDDGDKDFDINDLDARSGLAAARICSDAENGSPQLCLLGHPSSVAQTSGFRGESIATDERQQEHEQEQQDVHCPHQGEEPRHHHQHSNNNNNSSNSNSNTHHAPAADGSDHESLLSASRFHIDHEKLVSFQGSEYLLRGIRLARIMTGGGKMLKDSKGNDRTFASSESVDHIAYFISHNWSVDGRLKFLALAFKFNLNIALAAGFCTLLLGSVFGCLGLLPTIESDDYEYPIGYLTRIVTIPIILMTLMFAGTNIAFFNPEQDPVMFLDKACINQQDKRLQREGIDKLGAFLRVSDKMLVLLTETYLKKLWTVYEVASFLSDHEMSRLDVVPIMLPISWLLFVSLVYSYQYFMLIVHLVGVPRWVGWIVNCAGSIVYIYALRFWAREKVDIRATIANFTVHNARCAVESDRQIVYTNIAVFQKACGRVPRTATEAEALEAFDEHVRTELLAQFEAVFGRFNFTHSEYILLSMACAAAIHADCWCQVGAGQPWREAVTERCMDPFFDLFALPIWALCGEILGSRCLSPTPNSVTDLSYIILSNAIAGIFGNGMEELCRWMAARAKESDAWLVGAIIFEVVAIGATFPFFSRVGSLHRSNRSAVPRPPSEQGRPAPERPARQAKPAW